jgi:hypothetical protein
LTGILNPANSSEKLWLIVDWIYVKQIKVINLRSTLFNVTLKCSGGGLIYSGIDDLIRCYAIKLFRYPFEYLGIGRILFEVVHGCWNIMFCNIWFRTGIADTLLVSVT